MFSPLPLLLPAAPDASIAVSTTAPPTVDSLASTASHSAPDSRALALGSDLGTALSRITASPFIVALDLRVSVMEFIPSRRESAERAMMDRKGVGCGYILPTPSPVHSKQPTLPSHQESSIIKELMHPAKCICSTEYMYVHAAKATNNARSRAGTSIKCPVLLLSNNA